jgi:hypothetical protein
VHCSGHAAQICTASMLVGCPDQILDKSRNRQYEQQDGEAGPSQRVVLRPESARSGAGKKQTYQHAAEEQPPKHYPTEYTPEVLFGIGMHRDDGAGDNCAAGNHGHGEPVGPRYAVVERVDNRNDRSCDDHCQAEDEAPDDGLDVFVHVFLLIQVQSADFADSNNILSHMSIDVNGSKSVIKVKYPGVIARLFEGPRVWWL